MTGLFITFEGVEGCGKSTQIERMKNHLESLGHTCMVTREPGGVDIAEKIRGLLLDPSNSAMCPETELLLYVAARAQHVAERIRPAVEAGTIVLCDRYADSTTAYQRAGRDLPLETVRILHEIGTGDFTPDITFVIDVPVEIGLERARARRGLDRIEQEPVDFHERVRNEFLRIAESEPDRAHVIDGTQDIDAVTREVLAIADRSLEVRRS
jgi:dTMP kinase